MCCCVTTRNCRADIAATCRCNQNNVCDGMLCRLCAACLVGTAGCAPLESCLHDCRRPQGGLVLWPQQNVHHGLSEEMGRCVFEEHIVAAPLQSGRRDVGAGSGQID